MKPPDFLLCSKQVEDGVDFLQSRYSGVADIPLPCRKPAAAPLQQEGLLVPSAAGLQSDFFLLMKVLAKKKSQGILASAGLGAEAHRRKENALHWNNEGEAAFAVRPAKGFIELCFRGPLRHVGDTSLLVKEIIIGQKLPINSFRSCKCCQFPLCCSGSSGC